MNELVTYEEIFALKANRRFYLATLKFAEELLKEPFMIIIGQAANQANSPDNQQRVQNKQLC